MTTLATRCFVLGLVLISNFAFARPDEGLSPSELSCEYAANPTGVDVAQPRLSWKLAGTKRGLRQTAYQIQVFSRTNLLANASPDLWDSGKVVSDETHLIRYVGKKLGSSQQVFWNVRVWDENDQASASSDFASWTMGLLKSDDSTSSESGATGWKTKWICAQSASDSLLMRKEFSVKPSLKRAIAHVTGLGQYEVTLNGAKVGSDLLSPGWTDYNDTILYDTRDITTR